ncbi:type I 3-dehydroquinate dehydratase [Streptomyces sp. NPDC091268]|uniref:type I 3-dehydroquinate dehydratase n=1 Tax=Streptomyces sp. NPDC091268 TaxID=3365979 RepID=UPI0037FC71E5
MRDLLDAEIPLVAVSFGDEDSERLAQEAKAAGVDVAELRVDRFSRTDPDHVLEQVRAFASLPVLATVRSPLEGGEWKGTEEERLALFRRLAPEVQAVDIELSSRAILADVVSAAHENDALAIVSHHDFARTPATGELEKVVAEAKEAGADVVKVSTMVTCDSDVKRLASLLLKEGADPAGTRLIVIAMGPIGAVSRVFFPALGSPITYSFMGSTSSAPGQLDFAETFRLLRAFYPGFHQRKSQAS